METKKFSFDDWINDVPGAVEPGSNDKAEEQVVAYQVTHEEGGETFQQFFNTQEEVITYVSQFFRYATFTVKPHWYSPTRESFVAMLNDIHNPPVDDLKEWLLKYRNRVQDI